MLQMTEQLANEILNYDQAKDEILITDIIKDVFPPFNNFNYKERGISLELFPLVSYGL